MIIFTEIFSTIKISLIKKFTNILSNINLLGLFPYLHMASCSWWAKKAWVDCDCARSEFHLRYQSTRWEQFYPKLKVLPATWLCFLTSLSQLRSVCGREVRKLWHSGKNSPVIYFRTLRTQYSQFWINLLTSGTLVPRMKLEAGHDHNRPRRHCHYVW